MDANTAVREHIHDFSGFWPFLDLGGGVQVPTYFLIISVAFCLCVLWLVRRAKTHLLSRNTALDLSLVLMVAGFVGARLLHVLFEAPSYYAESLVRVFYVWQGGFVWYGGVIGSTVAVFGYMRWKQIPYGRWLDLFTPIIALGYALGRVACLTTGCCYGAVCHLESGYAFRHPTQVYAIIWESAALALLLLVEKSRTKTPGQNGRLPRVMEAPGSLFSLWLVMHGIGRIIMEIFRDDDRGSAIAGLSISTWISVGLIACGIAALAKMTRPSNSLQS